MSQRRDQTAGPEASNDTSSSRLRESGRARVARAAQRGPFSSELSAAELGLCADLGVRPLAQVMGACAYTIGVSGAPVLGDPGYREYFARRRGSGPVMFELRRISGAYNDARETALKRMREQAAQADARLVVGVSVTLTEHEADELQIVEYVATGTAMRVHDRTASRSVPLSPLSIAECWTLREAGYEPAGLAAATVVYYTRPSATTSQALGKRRRSAPRNQEFPDLSEAVTSARDICQGRMEHQARRQGGSGIIGMSLELRHSLGVGLRAEGAMPRTTPHGNLHLTVHGLASAVRPVQDHGPAPKHTTPGAVLYLR